MTWMNEYEIEDAVRTTEGLPNASLAARRLDQLMRWTNQNSDGWPYWAKPARSATRLMELLQGVDRYDPQDVTAAEVTAALATPKRFLTKHGADHSTIFTD